MLWLGWFSWWAPGPTFPALVLLAVLPLVLIHRLGRSGAQPRRRPDAGPPRPGGCDRPVRRHDRGPGQRRPGGQPTPGSAAARFCRARSPENPAPDWMPPGAGTAGGGPGPRPLIAPLNDTRRSMQAWFAEAGEAHRRRLRRRRPIKIGGRGWA